MVDGKAKVSLALVCSCGQGDWSCWSQSDTHTYTHIQRGPSANDSGLVSSAGKGGKCDGENEGDWWDRSHFSHHWSAIYSSLLLKLTSLTFAGLRAGDSDDVLGFFVCSSQSCLPQNLRNTLRAFFFFHSVTKIHLHQLVNWSDFCGHVFGHDSRIHAKILTKLQRNVQWDNKGEF